MAKAMLIMDEMPTICSECKLCGFDGVCHAVHEFCQYRFDKKQEWCPLRQVPQKKEEFEMDIIHHESLDLGKRLGYNACIDEILGGGE